MQILSHGVLVSTVPHLIPKETTPKTSNRAGWQQRPTSFKRIKCSTNFTFSRALALKYTILQFYSPHFLGVELPSTSTAGGRPAYYKSILCKCSNNFTSSRALALTVLEPYDISIVHTCCSAVVSICLSIASHFSLSVSIICHVCFSSLHSWVTFSAHLFIISAY